MGQRSRTETLAQVIVELMRERTISQAELSKRVQVSTRVIRQCVLDLTSAGMPVERQEDHPHVFYSVPKDWVPNGYVIAKSEARELVRFLARVPFASARRVALAARLGTKDPALCASLALDDSLEAHQIEVLEDLEDTASDHCAACIEYYSVERGIDEIRYISCQRIAYHERPIRLLAVCHRNSKLKWFRLDRIRSIQIDETEPFRVADEHAINEVVNNTVLDFHHPGTLTEHRFVVRAPEHRWFIPLLGPHVELQPAGDSVRVTMSASTKVLARQLVGLGDAIRIESEQLRAEVRSLAVGALAALSDEKAPV